jgi:hypothetical protein
MFCMVLKIIKVHKPCFTNNLFCLLIFFLFTLTACRQTVHSEEELLQYIQDPENGLIKVMQEGDVEAQVYYKPSILLAMQELKTRNYVDREKVEAEYDKNLCFMLSLSKNDQELEAFYYVTGNNFEEKVRELAFGMSQYVHIETDKGTTIALQDYIYPRMYGGSGKSTMMLIFEKEKFSGLKKFSLVLNDPGIGIGREKFVFEMRDIEKVPDLKL